MRYSGRGGGGAGGGEQRCNCSAEDGRMRGRGGKEGGGRKGGCVPLGKSEETRDKNPESKQMDLNAAEL